MSNDSIYVPTTAFILPKYDGYWMIGENFYIQIKKKTTEQQIKNTKELLGWEWKDEIQTKQMVNGKD